MPRTLFFYCLGEMVVDVVYQNDKKKVSSESEGKRTLRALTLERRSMMKMR